MTKINFTIATPEKVVYQDEVDQITLNTKMGEITVLPNHLPLVSSLLPGEILIKKDKEEMPLAVSGGFIEFAENKMVILADTAERLEEIDEQRAEEAKTKAKQMMEEKQSAEEIDYVALAAKLEKELARLKVARKYRHLKQGIKIKSDDED